MARAKFDIRTEASRPIYAGVGVTDLAVGLVRDCVADVQKRLAGVQKDVQTRVSSVELQPKALRDQAVTAVSARVATATETYADLAERGETLVERIRKQPSTTAAVSSARTTSAKAKTTRTQATQATKATATRTATKASTTAKKSSGAPRSSAKATTTAAKRSASNAASAATDGAAKVGD